LAADGETSVASPGPEADHCALKRLIDQTRGFKTLPTAPAAIKGFKVIGMIRKRLCVVFESGTVGEVCLANRLFHLAA
jgi:hypothetical protein